MLRQQLTSAIYIMQFKKTILSDCSFYPYTQKQGNAKMSNKPVISVNKGKK